MNLEGLISSEDDDGQAPDPGTRVTTAPANLNGDLLDFASEVNAIMGEI